MAIGDMNNDGRIDAVVTTNDRPAHILRNETASANHWLTLTLTGHRSNRDGIGAEIKFTAAHSSSRRSRKVYDSGVDNASPRFLHLIRGRTSEQ